MRNLSLSMVISPAQKLQISFLLYPSLEINKVYNYILNKTLQMILGENMNYKYMNT